MATAKTDPDLARRIADAKPGDEPFREKLQTSERVMRRVTDGIYREPWASIRELISNAYDADATEVVVLTDAPRFRQITVRDNGNGFTAEALAAMCRNIGGSSKRTQQGKELGVTADDPDTSPDGRRLIGKLGIGLFSISQLTQQFRIVTKVKGARDRIVADVILFRYSERQGHDANQPRDEVEATGEIQFTKVAAEDINAHGTDVIIDTLLPRIRTEFQSRDTWQILRGIPSESESEEPAGTIRPLFHIGYADPANPTDYLEDPCLPWQDDDDPARRFQHLVQAMYDRATQPGVERRPSLKTTFDNYLRFIWLIALSVPGDYLDCHPFDLGSNAGVRAFKLGKMKTGRAEEVHLQEGETIRSHLGLRAPERGGNPEFKVVMDGLELRRPIRYTASSEATNPLKSSLIFVGTDAPDTARFSDRVTGGPLRFEAYLFWTPRVIPVEHNGVLIRVGDASGSLFDETFMRYQISEQKRKEQVVAEIFVHEGMDAALNIDRESFNHSHPHYQYVASWVHDAFKQLATKHKAIGADLRKAKIAADHAESSEELTALSEEIVAEWSDGEEEPIGVKYVSEHDLRARDGDRSAVLVSDAVLVLATPTGSRSTNRKSALSGENQIRHTAVVQLLYAAGLLDKLSEERRQKLLLDIARIMFTRGAE